MCKSLKNKSDFDNVSPKILLDHWMTLSPALLRIINTSLSKGEFPKSWKDSMITPIEKIKDTNKCEEFRPINGLKTLEKLLEKVVKEQLEQYMEKNNLFSKFQSGFRKKYSCETAVNYLINEWKSIERQTKIMAVFLDFKRAFETIERGILIEKLKMYGIRDNELKWFNSYLTERTQRTKVNGCVSGFEKVEIGVPQGSILGALLFIVYINDIENVLKHCKIVMYADDTLIYAEGKNETECESKLSYDIQQVNLWLKGNKLKLNEQKTKMMEINMNSQIEIKINDVVIEKVDRMKYLGVIIDKNMKFNEHMEYICKKVGKKIGFLKRIRSKIDTITAINIYNVIIKPHFEYCSTILYTCCNQTQLNRLQKLQNKGMRCILKCNIYTPVRIMHEMLKWLNITQRLQYNTLMMIFKVKNGDAPTYLTDKVEYVKDVQKYHLRNSNDFRIKFKSTTAAQNSLFYKGFQLFNTLPENMKNEYNMNIFRRNCVDYIKNL